jgi:hypothetical protein
VASGGWEAAAVADSAIRRGVVASTAARERSSGRLKVQEAPALAVDPTAELMPKVRPPRIVRDLNSAEGWLKELSSIYRSARRGTLATDEASRLAYIAGVASKLARDLAELRETEKLRQQLEALQAQQPNTFAAIDYQSAPAGSGAAISGELLPADKGDDEAGS